MAVTKLLLSKSGRDTFYYLVREKEGSTVKRVLAFDTIGIMQGDYDYMFNQFKSVWKRAGKLNWKDSNGAYHSMNGGRACIQAISTIISFSNEDFPRLPGGGFTEEQRLEALEIARNIHEEMGYKQVFLVVQCDGVGGYLHVHGFVNAVDPVTEKTLSDSFRNYKRFRFVSDKVIQQFGLKPLDPDKENVLSPEERAKRKGDIPKDQLLFNEVLKDKILAVLNKGFTSREEFVDKLAAVGVKAEFQQEKNGKKGPEGIVYHMFDEYGKKHRNRKRKASNLGTEFMLQNVELKIAETLLKVEGHAESVEENKETFTEKTIQEVETNVETVEENEETFTEKDARELQSWIEYLNRTPVDGENDMTRNVMQRKIDELEAKRDKALGITKEKEKPEPKKTEKPVAEKIDERTPIPSSRRKTEEHKGRRSEDETHEVPIVKPLRDPDPYYGYGRGTDVPWLERLEDEKEEQEEITEVALEPVNPVEAKISEAQRERDEKWAEANAKYLEILNSNDDFYVPGGLPKQKDDKSVEK